MARGGSHFGGDISPRGSSGNSGSHFNSSSSHSDDSNHNSHHGSHGPRGGFFFHFGSHHHGGGSILGVLFSFIAVFAIFASVFLFVSSSMNTAMVREIENDYYYYQNMIAYAEKNTDHIVNATIVGKYKNPEVNKWYIEYAIIDSHELFASNGGIYRFTTYSIYTDEQILERDINQTIAVAVDSIPVTMHTDSVVMEYKEFNLEDDGEYVKHKKTAKNCKTAGIVVVSVGGALLLWGIFKSITDMRRERNEESVEPADDTYLEEETTTTKKKDYYCRYCGCKIDPNQKKCDHCGSSLD